MAEVDRTPRVIIEYCSRCNWMLRSAWLQQELLTTFNGSLAEVSLVPNHNGDGTFLCTVVTESSEAIVWDRKEAERFPEAKELKQRVRDEIEPSRDLGHSDGDGEDARGTGRTAIGRLLSVILGDRRNRGDPRAP